MFRNSQLRVKMIIIKKNESVLRLIFIFFNDFLIHKLFFLFLNIMNLTYSTKFSMSFEISVAKAKKWKFKFNHSMTMNILIVSVFSMCDSSKIFNKNFLLKFANYFKSLTSKFDSLMFIFFFIFLKQWVRVCSFMFRTLSQLIWIFLISSWTTNNS